MLLRRVLIGDFILQNFALFAEIPEFVIVLAFPIFQFDRLLLEGVGAFRPAFALTQKGGFVRCRRFADLPDEHLVTLVPVPTPVPGLFLGFDLGLQPFHTVATVLCHRLFQFADLPAVFVAAIFQALNLGMLPFPILLPTFRTPVTRN